MVIIKTVICIISFLSLSLSVWAERSPAIEVSSQRAPSSQSQYTGRVVNCRSNLNVREHPSTSSTRVGRLPCRSSGQVQVVARTDNGWYQINHNGRMSYVFSHYIQLDGEAPMTGEVFNCGTNLMVRSRPSASSRHLGRLPCDESPVVEILERSNGWFKINYNGQQAYVYSDYIKLHDSVQLASDTLEVLNSRDIMAHPRREQNLTHYCRQMGIEDCDGSESMIEQMESAIEQGRDIARHEDLVEELRGARQGYWNEGCEVLVSPSEASIEELGVCLDSLKLAALDGMSPNDVQASTRGDFFRSLYQNLNEQEQIFFAKMMTAVGEAGVLTPPVEEMIVIMKVLENRARTARERGATTANELDVAIQPLQFSIYNANATHHIRDFLNQTNTSAQTEAALRAFQSYENTDFVEPEDVDRIYHYHAQYARHRDWMNPNKRLPTFVVNNHQVQRQSGRRHIFYQGVRWSFVHNEWSGKR